MFQNVNGLLVSDSVLNIDFLISISRISGPVLFIYIKLLEDRAGFLCYIKNISKTFLQ